MRQLVLAVLLLAATAKPAFEIVDTLDASTKSLVRILFSEDDLRTAQSVSISDTSGKHRAVALDKVEQHIQDTVCSDLAVLSPDCSRIHDIRHAAKSSAFMTNTDEDDDGDDDDDDEDEDDMERACREDLKKVPSFCRRHDADREPCALRRQVAELADVYVDGGNKERPRGTVFSTQHGEAFYFDPYSIHSGRQASALLGEGAQLRSVPHLQHDMKQQQQQRRVSDNGTVVEYEELGIAIAPYQVFYHLWAEVIPRLLLLLDHLPGHVPIMTTAAAAPGAVDFLAHIYGDTVRSRLLPVPRRKLVFARRAFIVWESFRLHDDDDKRSKWQARAPQCDWVLGAPSHVLQQALFRTRYIAVRSTATATQHLTESELQLLMLHRSDAPSRQLENTDDVREALRQIGVGGQAARIVDFVGRNHSLPASFQAFHDSDIVLAPHGAGLVFMHGMRPETHVIELSFRDSRPNSHLTYDFFRLLARKLGLHYHLVVCDGDHDTAITCPPAEVAAAAARALKMLAARQDPRRRF